MTSTTSEQVMAVLGRVANPIVARGALRYALHQCDLTSTDLDREGVTPQFVERLEYGLKVMSAEESSANRYRQALHELLQASFTPAQSLSRVASRPQPSLEYVEERAARAEDPPGETIEIQREVDIVRARGRAREFAAGIGFGATDQTKIATAVSEVSRNIYFYARRGNVTLLPLGRGKGMRIEARDNGPGIADLESVLSGRYSSKTGMGLGLRGCKRLMDHFRVETRQGKGTLVLMEKELT